MYFLCYNSASEHTQGDDKKLNILILRRHSFQYIEHRKKFKTQRNWKKQKSKIKKGWKIIRMK